ncbi:hypothetical protein PAMA_002654 [Pampus argenteus]
MSAGRTNDDPETLFSFELLVEFIRIEREEKVSDQLALGLRLLDFPTLLIYQPEQKSDEMKHENKKRGEYTFNRGKSCVFKMNLHSLLSHLSHSPLYAMLLDVKEETPRLVGTSLISLAKVMDRVRQDVAERGVAAPSSHGERGLVAVCDLTGEKIGSISLSYKLLSLGASLLPHITDKTGLKRTAEHGGQNTQRSIKESDVTTKSPTSDCEKVRSSTPDDVRNRPSINEDEQDVHVAEQKPRSQTPQTLRDTEHCSDEDLTVFCPPHLYYSNSGEEKENYKSVAQDLEAFTFEDTLSEEESSPVTDRRAKTPSNREQTSVTTTNVLEEALRQFPLLNALLVELSHLNGQNSHQPLSIHPNLAWIYRPASTDPSAGQENTPRKTHTKSLQRTRLNRNCSPPICRPASEKQPKNKHKEALIESSKKKVESGSVAQNKDNTEHHSESNQSQSESDGHRQKVESSRSSRHSSPKSSLSASSGEGSEDADYADDFNSLEPSDAYSPDPASSPELARAKTPKSPVRLDFCNFDPESVQRRAVLPVPIKACSSPQHALRGTHVIRPRTQASALSFSSDDGDGEGSASIRTVRSRKHTPECSKAERSSGAESVRSSRGRSSDSTKNSGPVRGLSAESVSSFKPQEADEVEDELGSLDFRKEYQHISELVSNKLPGYTM